jgi:hypothetical protein
MSAIHGLSVVRGVPVRIVKDDGVGGGKVDSETSGTGGEQEDEEFGSVVGEIRKSGNGRGKEGNDLVCQSVTMSRRSEMVELPSRRRYLCWRKARYSSNRSIMRVIWK